MKPDEKEAVRKVRRCDPDLSRSLEPLWERLADTIEWCRRHVDARAPRQCLRRDETRPRTLERDYFTAVSMAAAPRRHRTPGPAYRSLKGGRVLVYFPDAELADGAAEVESDGFFDVHNAPPWDTWLAMVEDGGRTERNPYLLAWVPNEFLDHAQRGIDVNPEECILWLEDCDMAIRRILLEGTGQHGIAADDHPSSLPSGGCAPPNTKTLARRTNAIRDALGRYSNRLV